jgi:hypothetical protein
VRRGFLYLRGQREKSLLLVIPGARRNNFQMIQINRPETLSRRGESVSVLIFAWGYFMAGLSTTKISDKNGSFKKVWSEVNGFS